MATMQDKKSEILEEAKRLEEETSRKDKVIQEQADAQKALMEQIEMLKNSFEEMKNQNTVNNTTTVQQASPTLETEYSITCNLIGKNNISIDKDGSYAEFFDSGDSVDLTHSEIKSLLKFKKNRELFIAGLLSFDEEESYSVFKIKSNRIINDEYIKRLLTLSGQDFVKEANNATGNKKYKAVIHNIIYRSAYLFKIGEIVGLSRDTMEAFKDYFGIGLADAIPYDEVI